MKKILFELGMKHFRQYVPNHSDCYMCPICFFMFSTDDYLTLEHVPPKSFGGKIMCLTCKSCNNDSGSTSESHMAREARSRALTSKSDDWLGAKLTVNELSLNVSARWKNGVFEVNGLPSNNNPRKTKEFTELLESNPKDYSFQITSATTYNPEMSAAGFLKTAYLVAFSKFGYQYILKQELEKVRGQIRKPEQSILPAYRLKLAGDDTTVNKILLVKSPVNAIIIQLGTIGIPLPGLEGNSDDVYSELLRVSNGEEGQLDFDEVDWPVRMEMIIDKQLAVRPNAAMELTGRFLRFS